MSADHKGYSVLEPQTQPQEPANGSEDILAISLVEGEGREGRGGEGGRGGRREGEGRGGEGRGRGGEGRRREGRGMGGGI